MINNLVTIIIANFNGEKYLETCLSSVLRTSYRHFELIIVDDGSSDGSLQIIDKFKKRNSLIKLLINSKNIGAAASRNKALKVAKGKIVVFLDNDTRVEQNWLTNLIKPLIENSDVGAAQALILDYEKPDLIQMAGGLLIPQTAWLLPFYQWQKYSKIKDKLSEKNIVAISAALAVRKDAINKVGSFDENEAIYTEDIDFCWRIWIAGFRIVLAPHSKVYHWTKSIQNRSNMNASLSQIYYTLAKNSFRSIVKNYEVPRAIIYLFVSASINIGRGFLFVFTRGKFDALEGSSRAFLWFMLNIGNVIEERNKVQLTRKFSDDFLIKNIFTHLNLLEIYNTNFR